MKQNCSILFFLFLCINSFSQTNLDFENWVLNYNGIDEAKNWLNTSDASQFNAPQTLFKETENPFSGLASIKLTTAYWELGALEGVDTLVGALVQQAPFSKKPKNFEFSYQSFPQSGDAILIGVQLSKTINDSDIIIGEGFFTTSKTQEIWKKKKVKIEYYSGYTPDKISIVVLSSANAVLRDGSFGHAKIGSTLLLDNLKIGSEKEEKKPSYYMYIFPNPAKSYINVETNDPEAKVIQIYNLSGELVIINSITQSSQNKVDISSLPNGIYIYKVLGENTIITSNKFNVIH
jgi:hypothetical protein